MAGRGFGKTRSGSEWTHKITGGKPIRVALVAATAADARDVMAEGESGIVATGKPWHRPKYEPSKRRITWPNGSLATLYSADEPDRLRGPQHHAYWADELAAWRYPDAWHQLQLGLRLGNAPRGIVTTTPRPTELVRKIARDAATVVTGGSTYDNRANLAPSFLDEMRRRYEGTRLGRQELYAEILDDNPGALWKRDAIDTQRVTPADVPPLARIVVAVDPAVTALESSDETGIVVVGVEHGGRRFYVLADESRRQASPEQWARIVVAAYHAHHADRIVVETNQGGDMVAATLRTVDRALPIREVRATRGKQLRAEPIAALYEQQRVFHVGAFPKLEDQMCEWDPANDARSPDRVDALVYALTDLSAATHAPMPKLPAPQHSTPFAF